MISNQEIKIAPTLSRTIALIFDFFLLTAGIMVIDIQGLVPFDSSFIFSLIWGLIYFGIGNSFLFSGQTIGKAIFGIRVVNLKSAQLGEGLPIFASMVRYLFSFGFLIIIGEGPKVFYRAQAISANPALLETNMLIALLIFFFSIACLLIRSDKRALHDLIAPSLVISCPRSISTEEIKNHLTVLFPSTNQKQALKEYFTAALASFFLASSLWYLSINHSQAFSYVASRQFVYENKYPLRFVNIQETQNIISLTLVVIADANLEDLSREVAIDLFKSQNQQLQTIKEIYFNYLRRSDSSQEVYVFNVNDQLLRKLTTSK